MSVFAPIAAHMAKNTFYTYKNLFNMVGFDTDDLISIANVHLVSFLGLFSLDKLPEKYNDFVSLYKFTNNTDPNEEHFLNKNKANCTLFLQQRMEDVVRVCRQKARNIKGLPTEEYFFYYGKKKPPLVLRDLVDSYGKFGYRKLDQAVYKSIKKKVRGIEGPVFRFNDMYYVAVPVEQKSLRLTDLVGAGMDPYDSQHHRNPEQIYFSMEDDSLYEKNKKQFNAKSKNFRIIAIRKFIEKNKKNLYYKDELKAARKMLKSIT